MSIETVYLIEAHEDSINLTLGDLSSGPLAILWENSGHRGMITREKVSNAMDVLEDMAKHKGPDVGEPFAIFHWDDVVTPTL